MKGFELKIFRTIFNLSQQEAAEEIGGVTQRSWAYWENSERRIPNDVIAKCNELLNRRKQSLELVKNLGDRAHKIAVVFYDNPTEAGLTILEVRYNNSLCATLASEYGAVAVKFDAEKYINWLTDNGLIDSPQKRNEWATTQIKE